MDAKEYTACPQCGAEDALNEIRTETWSYRGVTIMGPVGSNGADSGGGEEDKLDSDLDHYECEFCGSRWETAEQVVEAFKAKGK